MTGSNITPCDRAYARLSGLTEGSRFQPDDDQYVSDKILRARLSYTMRDDRVAFSARQYPALSDCRPTGFEVRLIDRECRDLVRSGPCDLCNPAPKSLNDRRSGSRESKHPLPVDGRRRSKFTAVRRWQLQAEPQLLWPRRPRHVHGFHRVGGRPANRARRYHPNRNNPLDLSGCEARN